MQTNNPFASAGTIVNGDLFVGRSVELTEVYNRVLGKNFGNLSIVGIPKIGKSSLMQALYDRRNELYDNNKYVVVWYTFKAIEEYADDEPREIFIDIARKVKKELKRHGYDVSEISYYVNEVSNLEMRFTEFQSTLLDMFEELVYNGIRVILCLDEFDYCKNYLEECHFQLLRELSYRPENKIAIVTASRRSIHDIEKDSGGGSNFFETFKKIYLKPFSIEDIRLQRNLIDGVSENDCILLDKAVGRHPYLNAIILDEFFNTRDMKSSIDKQINSVLTHYDYLFRILKKDKLDDKVVKLYSGFSDTVSQEEEEYIYNRYGIFDNIGDNKYVPFCDTFEQYLSQLYRTNPYNLLWGKTERGLRAIIKYALDHEYGDDVRLWDPEIRDLFSQEDWSKYVTQRRKEKELFKGRASDCIIDQLYPRHYIVLIEEYWDGNIDAIMGHTLNYWRDELAFICRYVRNPEAHSRIILNNAEKTRATVFCQEVIKRCQLHRDEVGELE